VPLALLVLHAQEILWHRTVTVVLSAAMLSKAFESLQRFHIGCKGQRRQRQYDYGTSDMRIGAFMFVVPPANVQISDPAP